MTSLGVREALEFLVIELKKHSSFVTSGSNLDAEALEKTNAALRSRVQDYEDAVERDTGTPLDLWKMEEDGSEELLSLETEQFSDATPTLISVFSRHDYLTPGLPHALEDLDNAESLCSMVVTVVPDRPLPDQDSEEWPPDNYQEWLKPEGEYVRMDLFLPT